MIQKGFGLKWSAKEIQEVSVETLIPYDRNPRIHSEEQIESLANSIRQWGFTIPILVDEKFLVIAGHGRLFAAQKVGLDSVPVIMAQGWSDEEKKAYTIADNKLAENSKWDDDVLRVELRSLIDSEYQMDNLGFSQFELDSKMVNELYTPFEVEESLKAHGITPAEVVDFPVPKKTDHDMVEFSCVMEVWQKQELVAKIREIKDEYQIRLTGEALGILIENYKNVADKGDD
ncbi:MAG: hypothetical protein CBC83_00150 [Flavobacteriales bacterium TMED123]|nr:MAG: hypothetical protein CBC83_00150 [Flavobacteriales bacterium TMED123]|tara:strand:- start:84 stop:776 length:693 start_codon:yes stop_codon:yes gene_type:complete